LVGRANIGNREIWMPLSATRKRKLCSNNIILKLPGEYKQDFVMYENENFVLFGLDSI
jgi:hypothetical protein